MFTHLDTHTSFSTIKTKRQSCGNGSWEQRGFQSPPFPSTLEKAGLPTLENTRVPVSWPGIGCECVCGSLQVVPALVGILAKINLCGC
jgi:hypothetical protein